MFKVDFSEVDRLQRAMQNFPGDTESTINDVLHNFAGDRAQEEIYKLMPVSSKKRGAHAKGSKSLSNINGNLSVTVAARGKWHYLYFSDDGTSTRRHVGNQRFFERGGDAAQDEIVERCITKLIDNFE